MACWFEVLASYDCEIQHRAGKSHINADALSRRLCIEQHCLHCLRKEHKENKEDEGFKKKQLIGNSNQIVCATTRSRQQNEAPETTRDDILFLKEQQRNDPVFKFIIEAKGRDLIPEWSNISAAMKDSMKCYWQRWDLLELKDGILYYKLTNTRDFIAWLDISPPSAKETRCCH